MNEVCQYQRINISYLLGIRSVSQVSLAPSDGFKIQLLAIPFQKSKFSQKLEGFIFLGAQVNFMHSDLRNPRALNSLGLPG